MIPILAVQKQKPTNHTERRADVRKPYQNKRLDLFGQTLFADIRPSG